ncbi:MAG: hypothetical protein H6554_03930 [Chitinophagales bacterium]|nr:hypothetical protein [Chitinophagales bacterium]
MSDGLNNTGETINLVDNCGNTVNTVTYNTATANGDCNAQTFNSSGTFVSAGTPTVGQGSETVTTENYPQPL